MKAPFPSAVSSEAAPGASTGSRPQAKAAAYSATVLTLALLLAVLGSVEYFVPLRSAVQIGADEGLELAKALLVMDGHRLYTEVWNDQPPLHTFLVVWVLGHVSNSILAPRLMTLAFAVLALWSLCFLAWRRSAPLAAALAPLLLLASPGFIELSSSCMLEVPALGTAVVALAALDWRRRCENPVGGRGAFASGLVFGAALQMKLIVALLLPVAAFTIVANPLPAGPRWRALGRAALWFGLGLGLSFAAIQSLIGDGAFFRQAWDSHFAAARSSEYGSAADHPFDWSVLLKNWDLTFAALVGFALSVRAARGNAAALIPAVWLGISLGVFAAHRPWWSYYYVHLAIPLCWLGAIAWDAGWCRLKSWQRPGPGIAFSVVAVCACAWAGGRLYLQVEGMRQLPKTGSSLVIAEMKRFGSSARWMFAEEPVYSFHAGIPLPPSLAVLSLKRFWSGDMTNARLDAELRAAKPGIILLANKTRAVPFEDLLGDEYRLVYVDQAHRLYTHRGALHDGSGASRPESGVQWELPKSVPAK